MPVPTDRSYTAEHEWILLEENPARVGVTEFAADALGDVVFVDLPAVGSPVVAGEPCGEIESTKSVSELYAPADGVVAAVNERVAGEPELVNTDPYGEGWLFRIHVENPGELIDAGEYERLTGALGAR